MRHWEMASSLPITQPQHPQLDRTPRLPPFHTCTLMQAGSSPLMPSLTCGAKEVKRSSFREVTCT